MVLVDQGFFSEAWFEDYFKPDCPLTAHPMNKIPGVKVCTGAMGYRFFIK
jgi:transketolase N-terminal domain/subunit